MRRASEIVRLFLSAEGRLSRGPFWLATGFLILGLAAFDAGLHGPARAWLAAPVKAALFVSGACVLAKRLHDRSRAGWWSAAPLLAFCTVWPQPRQMVDWGAAAVLAIAVVELGVRPGVRRFNRFGPVPARD